jgi:uncharacterized protein (DUF433 family)
MPAPLNRRTWEVLAQRAIQWVAPVVRAQGEILDETIGVSMDSLLSRITIDPAVCHGKPCVRGLRYPIEVLLELLSSGMTVEEIMADYEDLEREDLLAVLAFAARLSQTT